MLKKKNRLRKKEDIDRVFKSGRTIKEEFLMAKILKNNENETRFAFSIGINFSKKATSRNKLKRAIKGVINEKINFIENGLDVVFFLPKNIKEPQIDFKQISKIAGNLLLKNNLLKK